MVSAKLAKSQFGFYLFRTSYNGIPRWFTDACPHVRSKPTSDDGSNAHRHYQSDVPSRDDGIGPPVMSLWRPQPQEAG